MKRLDIEVAVAEGFRTLLKKPAVLFPSFISSLLFAYLFHISMQLGIKPEEVKPDEALFFLKIFIVIILIAIYLDSVTVRLAYTKSSVLRAFGFALKKYIVVLVATLIYALIVALGTLALIVPGIYLAVRLYYFIDAIMIDEKGTIESLRISWKIAKGNWWTTFLILLILGILSFFINMLLSSAFAIVSLGKYRDYIYVAQIPIITVFRAWSCSAFVQAYLMLRNREISHALS